jgi:hypothetical protein
MNTTPLESSTTQGTPDLTIVDSINLAEEMVKNGQECVGICINKIDDSYFTQAEICLFNPYFYDAFQELKEHFGGEESLLMENVYVLYMNIREDGLWDCGLVYRARGRVIEHVEAREDGLHESIVHSCSLFVPQSHRPGSLLMTKEAVVHNIDCLVDVFTRRGPLFEVEVCSWTSEPRSILRPLSYKANQETALAKAI